jgi:EmrB/QacA subfamily drug resistance transporter
MSDLHDHTQTIPLQPLGTTEAGRFRTVFLRVAPAMFLATLDQTIVAAALPVIGASLGGLAQVAWVVTAYLLAATIAAPIYGRMGDAFGYRRMLLWALGLFLAGSIACAAARSMVALVIARGLQGFGGGGLMTLAQALIGEAVPPKDRGRFQGWFGANFALASTLGPMAGGFLSQHYGWRSIFWVNVPLGLYATLKAQRIQASRGTGLCRLDYAGTGLFAAATIALLLGLSFGGAQFAWLSPVPIALCFGAAVGFMVLAHVETHTADPLISPQVIDHPVVWRSVLCVFLFAGVLFGLIVQLPLFFQAVFKASPTVSGLMLVPLTLAQVAVSTATGRQISITGHPRKIMMTGLLIVTAGFLALAVGAGFGQVFSGITTLVIGAGLGTTMPAAQTMVQWAAGTHKLGAATGSLSVSRSFGGVIGTALTSSVLFGFLHAVHPQAVTHFTPSLESSGSAIFSTSSFVAAFRWMFLALAALSAMATLVARSISDVDLASASPDSNGGEVNLRQP